MKDHAYLIFVFEFLTIVTPLLFFLTLAFHLLFLFYACFIVAISLAIFLRKDLGYFWIALQNNVISDEKPPCVTVFRAVVNVFTVICILAADFTCFPRRFLKTESFGYGLMDTGVGLFVIIYSFTDSPYKPRRSLRYFTYKILPFFVLGLGRYFCTEALRYQHQVTEYGTQWNFFITLLVLTLFNEIVLNFLKSVSEVFFLAVLFLVTHELVLAIGLKQWILSDAPRLNFFSSNREGIFSLLGYETLSLSGMVISYFLPKKNDLFRKYVSVLLRYFLGFLLCITLTILADFSIGVFRKTANSGYIFWILSLTFLTFVSIFSCDIALRICIHSRTPIVDSASLIMKAINYNGLLFFLLGNVLTGLINLNIKTLLVNEVQSVLIILLYMFTCCAFIVFCTRRIYV